jgi:L-iditol 2-dehydrogenase
MKALVLEYDKHLAIHEVSTPTFAHDECLVQIAYAGICSSDIYRSHAGGAYSYPLVMGHELAGHIVACGSSIVDFKPGDRVAVFPLKPCFSCAACTRHEYARCGAYDYYGSRCNGGFAEYLNVKGWNLVSLPDDISLRDAALIEPTAVVHHALRRAEGLRNFSWRGKNILIIGAGFMGLSAVRILKQIDAGVTVTVIDRRQGKLDLAARYGAVPVCLVSEKAWEEYIAGTGAMYDVVVEASGAPANFVRAIRLAAPAGTVLWLGNITNDLVIPMSIVSSVLRKELHIVGTWNSTYKTDGMDDWHEVVSLMRTGFSPSDMVSYYCGLDNAAAMFHKMYEHKTGNTVFEFIKCVVDCNGFIKGNL